SKKTFLCRIFYCVVLFVHKIMYFALLYSAFKPSKAQNAAKKQHKHTAGAIISFLLHFIMLK
ncbi:hypothetical protein, partial [Ruminococcus bicirculans (ex Wegman et al. 2014)]|uniref:hypothetical protein n=1 Tax=Ruminococcus bicirculans (ex Wegman et al. 2014) TaxID=1160721 RepID=UPI00366D6A3F